jgi:hypothetical protein
MSLKGLKAWKKIAESSSAQFKIPRVCLKRHNRDCKSLLTTSASYAPKSLLCLFFLDFLERI